MSGLYEFKEEDAYSFARYMGIETKVTNGNLHFRSCPYCKVKHDKWTFAISLKTGMFNCLRSSCGATGNMITLSQHFDFSLGNMADEYYRPQKNYKTFGKPKKPYESKSESVQYLESRKISRTIAEKYEITVRSDNNNVLVFPFYDENGELCFIKYRNSKFVKGKTNGSKEFSEPGGKPILFGMKQCEDFTTLIITEGQIDSLSVADAGIKNAVSVPNGAKGFTWIPYCWNWINQFQEIIVFGDFENRHITLLDELSKCLKIRIKHVREEDYKDCKDANEILQKYGAEQIRKCVENAVAIPVKRVIRLADVEAVDIYKIPKVKTGIYQIDRLLYGGLPVGGVVLISGKTGSGKSTIASQIIINAVHQGYKCFAYSGELANWQFKMVFHFQIAGGNFIDEHQNQYGDMDYGIPDTYTKLIEKWYEDNLYLYDNSVIPDEEDEQESLINTMENVIAQYGVQVLLLDNLMTAIDLEAAYGSDKYERQSLFMKKLARLALAHNVLILLVAHKRKNNFSSNENDEVMGASDISNLATIAISYDRDKDINDDQRLCKVSKNRLFGKVNLKGYILDFDEKSRRIYGYKDDANIDYGWNTNKSASDDGFTGINVETPFD